MDDINIRVQALNCALSFYGETEVSSVDVVTVAQVFYDFLTEVDDE